MEIVAGDGGVAERPCVRLQNNVKIQRANI